MGIIRIILAVVIFQAVGFIWYGPLWGKCWSAIIGRPMGEASSEEEKKAMRGGMIATYLFNLLASVVFILGYLVIAHTSFLPPLAVGIVVYVALILPLLAQNALWSGKSRRHTWQMFLLQAGYQLLAIATLWVLFK